MWRLFIENRIRFGMNVGFEFYTPDEDNYDYEFHLNILIIRIGLTWH